MRRSALLLILLLALQRQQQPRDAPMLLKRSDHTLDTYHTSQFEPGIRPAAPLVRGSGYGRASVVPTVFSKNRDRLLNDDIALLRKRRRFWMWGYRPCWRGGCTRGRKEWRGTTLDLFGDISWAFMRRLKITLDRAFFRAQA
jgi:hypothetical protein